MELSARRRRLTFRAGTLSRFIQRYGIGMHFRQIASEDPNYRRYVITITRPAVPGYLQRMAVPYFQGLGVSQPPELEGVMWAVGQDTLDYYLSEDDPNYYAETFGIEPEEALETFMQVQAQSERLKDFLGQEGYDELIEITLGGAEE